MPQKLILANYQCPGDVACLTAALRDLHAQYPGVYETDYVGWHGRLSNGNDLFAHSPYITPFYDGPASEIKSHVKEGRYIEIGYDVCGECSRRHFATAFHVSLGKALGHPIEPTLIAPDIHLSVEDRELWPGLPKRYAVIDAGRKDDMTTKFWSTHRFQDVVDQTKDQITWVQIGGSGDYHPPLSGVINLVGQTNLRQLIRVIYGSFLVLTPVSLPMHLAAGVPTFDGRRRACVVLMGRREQRIWEAYPDHAVLGTDGYLPCGEKLGGGCWMAKTVPPPKKQLAPGASVPFVTDPTVGHVRHSVCRRPMQDEAGEWTPDCLHRVSAADVVQAIGRYL